MNFKDFLNENNYTIETKKTHLNKLGEVGVKLIGLGKKYNVEDIWVDRKNIFIVGFKSKKDVEDFTSEIKGEFSNINGFIKSPMGDKWSLTVDTSKPEKMKTD